MVWRKLTNRITGKREQETAPPDKGAVKTFRRRYARFRKLLDANAALAELMADMEVKLNGSSLFGLAYVQHCGLSAIRLTRRMADSLEQMNPGKHSGLSRAVDRIETHIAELIGEESGCQGLCRNLTIGFPLINLTMVDWVGGKCANLGEMLNMAGIPVPRGFAITITAFKQFMAHEDLEKDLQRMLGTIRTEDRDSLAAILEQIRERVEQAPLPPELDHAIEQALRMTFGDEDVHLAVRSSAQAEDGEKSFAGQFLSELNVSRATVADSYRRVVASLFTPAATLYRLHQGIPLSEASMAVACLEMVDAEASGVAYSHDPVDLMNETLLINGIWGLGRYAVDGQVSPDMWVFTREENPVLVRRRTATKDRMLRNAPGGDVIELPVPEELQRRLCLSAEEAHTLARFVMRLDAHYGSYQDIEWAKNKDGDIIFLQSRPLETRATGAAGPKPPLLTRYPLLIEGGDIASPGVGHGIVVMPKTQEELLNFPEGGILVAAHSSSEYVTVMDKAQAVLAQTGGITGHMATICREFHIPTLLNLPGLMQMLQPGMEITVDAFSGRVYEGKAEELLPLRLSIDPVRLQDTPVHSLLHDVSQHILPLHLTDPSSGKFSPAHCTSLHDVMRYAHEKSYQEMFAISDSASQAGNVAMKLKAPLPIDLHIIDLDKGTTLPPGAVVVKPEQILSAPLKALLQGMLHPDVMFRRPRPINMGGFISVMGQQMGNPQGGDARFGDKSYAIISDRYMNFSSRVGYHYSVLDAYCGDTVSKNYISFSFQGGAAGETRRVRRIRAIALVLEELDFTVAVQGDMVKSRFQKYPKESIEERLDQLGRLLQVTRQMDMLMSNDEAIMRFRDDFMNGIYR